MDSQTIAELITVLTAKVDQIQSGVDQANQSIQDYEKQAKDSNKEASGAFGLTEAASIAAALGIVVTTEKLIDFGKEAFEAAAHAEALEAATDAVAANMGYAAGATEQARKAVEDMGYTGEQAAKLVSILVKAHMDLGRATELAKVAMDIAALSGKGYGETLDMVANAVNTGNARILRQAGIVTNVNQVLSEYAATLGKTAAQLTDQERRQAILNAIVEKGTQLHGAAAAAMHTSGGQLDILSQQSASAKEHIGELISAAIEPVIIAANGMLAIFNKVAASPLWAVLKDAVKENWATLVFGPAAGAAAKFMEQVAKVHASLLSMLPKEVQDKILSLFSSFEPSMQAAANSTDKAGSKLKELVPTMDQLITRFRNLQVTQKDFADDTMPDILKKTTEYMKIQGMSYNDQITYLKDLDKRFKLSADQRAQLAKHVADLENQYNQQVAQAYTQLMTQGFTQVANAAAQSFTAMVGDFQGATVNIAQIWENLLNKLVQEFIASGILDLLSLIPGLGFLAPAGGGLAGALAGDRKGFDDPVNDAMARNAGSSKWWNDFANNYSKGYVDSALQTAPSMHPGGSNGGTTIINYYDQPAISLGDPARERQAANKIATIIRRNGMATA